MTGLTKDGQAVSSSRYHLYGARKTSTDTTGNPFAYNGEARDDTGLDYLRARYYDSQGGTFLTEDSYPGEATDPLSQNHYSYVQNNPVNYTDPSGHFWNSIKKGWNYVKKTASNAWNGVKRVASNTWNGVKSVASKAWNVTKSAFNHATNWVRTQVNRASNWVGRQWNKVQTTYNSASDYVQTKYQQAAAQIEAKRQQVVRSAYALATGLSSSPTIREGMNLLRNWGTALQNTLKHVCTTAERVKNQVVDFVKNVDWKKVAIVAAATVAAVAVSVATAGAAAPVVAGLVGSVGLTGFGAAVATGVGVGVIAGAAGGGTQALVSGALSGKDGKTILKDTWEGIKGGAVTGAFTGGLTAGLGAASSSVTNGLVRHGVDTVGETVIDTISDAAQGGQITPTSIGTSLFLNAVTEGVSSRTVRAPKADVVTTKPKSGDVPVTRPRKDVTPVQQLALPGPTSKPLALPAPDPVLALPAPKADVVTTKPTGGRLPMTVENLQMFAEKPKVTKDNHFNNWLDKGSSNNSVYYGIDANTEGAVYTGITKQDLESRLYQHNRQGKNFSRLDERYSGLTRNQARAVEQYLIENGHANQLNKINSISPKNKMYDGAMKWAEKYLNGGN